MTIEALDFPPLADIAEVPMMRNDEVANFVSNREALAGFLTDAGIDCYDAFLPSLTSDQCAVESLRGNLSYPETQVAAKRREVGGNRVKKFLGDIVREISGGCHFLPSPSSPLQSSLSSLVSWSMMS